MTGSIVVAAIYVAGNHCSSSLDIFLKMDHLRRMNKCRPNAINGRKIEHKDVTYQISTALRCKFWIDVSFKLSIKMLFDRCRRTLVLIFIITAIVDF